MAPGVQDLSADRFSHRELAGLTFDERVPVRVGAPAANVAPGDHP